ncbi:MAG: DUF1826 domain-containing protein [Pseudomonadota bacterium]
MSLATESTIDAALGVGVVDRPEALSAIADPGCAAAIWRRDPQPGAQAWLDALAPEQLPRARLVLRPEAVRKTAQEICETCGTPPCPERDRLVEDAAALADLFAGLTKAPFLRLRFDVVTTNACRKFHVDAVRVRLVCTYRGTGTQYGNATDGAEPSPVFTVPTGAPILLRGTLWPEHPKSGLLHRSPPIEGTGETRLMLVLDPIYDLDEEPERELVH